HIVLSTLHTNSAAAAPNRLLDMGVPDFLVASALTGVLAQRLCRRLCTRCARPATELPPGIAAIADGLLGETQTLEAVGCNHCGNTGYDGRVGIFELLVVSDEVRRAILDRRDDQSIAHLARQQGTRPLVEDGIDKVRRGQTTVAELVRVAGHLDGVTPASSHGTFGQRQHAPANRDFDVNGYERLLHQWLQREVVETIAIEEQG
ncbi:MAG: Flp pilus assembly complex ATPase component TadA, partial [Phycisphaerae bacterium]|nr:Flp pilus assembly complex ATPase component TadA [Phycisphaerae bacterium]